MTTAFPPVQTKLVSAKAAAQLVPYTRDYIARIAREGKIHAVQIDRQWFVEETSLQNFYQQSLLEEVVRKQHLSQKRKLDLEVKEHYLLKLKELEQKRLHAPIVAAIVAVLVLGGGLSSGLWFLNNDSAAYLASLSSAHFGVLPPTQSWQHVQVIIPTQFVSAPEVEESTRALALEGGIVLLPESSKAQQLSEVSNLFSDTAVVNMTGSSTGIIEVEQQGVITTMPFVRIPDQEVMAEAQGLIANDELSP